MAAPSILPAVTSASGRTYTFVADKSIGRGSFLRINDSTQPWLSYIVRTFRPEFARSLGRLGYWLRAELRSAVEHGGPSGAHWPELSRVQTFRALDDLMERRSRNKPATHPYASLEKAIGYKADKDQLRVRVGWLSATPARLAAQLQAGFETPITKKMREMYFAAEVGLVKSGAVRTPARPLVRPVYQQVEAEIPRRIEAFVSQYCQKSKASARAA